MWKHATENVLSLTIVTINAIFTTKLYKLATISIQMNHIQG